MLRLLFVGAEPPADLLTSGQDDQEFRITRAEDTDGAALLLAQETFDVALLDALSEKAETVRAIIDRLTDKQDMAVIVLVSEDQSRRANIYLSAGAQDYLTHDQLTSERLVDAARSAMERKSAEKRIADLSQHDPLTGLPNGEILRARLDRKIAMMPEEKHYLGLHLIDLDRFSELNDTLGRDAGDNVLKAVALRLMEATRASDLLVRLSKDRFALVHDHIDAPEDAAALASRMIDRLAKPIIVGNHEVYLSARIGIALYPDNASTTDALLRAAELALHAAKADSSHPTCFYNPKMTAKLISRNRLEHDLRRALDQDHFVLHYQPKVDMATGRVNGVEALVRWRSPDRGLILPASFIPTAESRGLIDAVGRWVLRAACDDLSMFISRGLPRMPIAINLSPSEMCDDSLVADIVEATRKVGLPPSAIEIEITETAMPRDMSKAFGIMARLRELNIEIAIDDFGTAYASLMHLQKFPFTKIKIDRAFIGGIDIDPDAQEIVRTIIALGHSLDMSVVAEGVESEAQYEFLKKHGCDTAQGYWFSKPLPADKLLRLLSTGLSISSMAPRQSQAY